MALRLATDVDRVLDRLAGTRRLTRSTSHCPGETISILGVAKTRVVVNV